MPSTIFDRASKPEAVLEAVRALPVGRINLMEVCGTHTMAIAKSGIKSMLPENIRLLSGPGCPVCVTPPELIDAILDLSMDPNVIIASYGDMVRVPGSRRGDSLQRRRALGANVRIVYSPMDAVDLAENTPDKEIVFLGVGFETTAPGTAIAVMSAAERGINNFSLFSMLKIVEPALRALIAMDNFDVQGFLCPGHVATIIGAKGFEFLPREFSLPAVVSGFEPEDILLSVYRLAKQISINEPKLENEYTRAVNYEGNEIAQEVIKNCFCLKKDIWRGLGEIEGSGLKLKDKFAAFDGEKKFNIKYSLHTKPTPCRCDKVITGQISPKECPMFGKVCTPEDPLGPCMVSSEGACAAAYKYSI